MIKHLLTISCVCFLSTISFAQNYSEGFEGSFPPSGWSAINIGNEDDDWRAQTAITIGASSISPFEGSKYAASYSVTGGFGLIPNNWLVTPQLTINASTSSLSFAGLGATTFGEWTAPGEFLEVLVSTTGNATADFTTSLWSNRFGQAAVWSQFDISLAAYNGQNIYLAFKHHDSFFEYFVAVDDVSISSASVVGGGLVDNDNDTYMSDVDCDDNNPMIYPGATEICDLIDNDCDGQTDEGLATTSYFLDTDMDSYGTGTGIPYCANPGAGFATQAGDCNDGNAAINPGATDIPNNTVDEDCNGSDATINVTATNDTGSCVENAANASVSILANDLINGAVATLTNAEVDLDLVATGFQNTFTAVSPNVTWTFDNVFFGTLACDPGTDVEGTVTLNYRVCDKLNQTDCSGTATVTVVIAPSTVSLNEQAIVFAVFPNPTKEQLTISSASKVVAVNVIGLDGKVVLNSSESTMNVSTITNGLYHIEVSFENGTIGRSTFMKN